MSKTPEVVNNLGHIRKQRGVSAAALAKLAGISRQTIYAIEGGAFVPNTTAALKLARALETSVEELFALPGRPGSPQFQTRRTVLLPGTDRIQTGQPLQLCEVDRRLVASSPAPVPWYFPASDGIAIASSEARDRTRTGVQMFQPADDLGSRILVAGCDPGMSILARHARSAGLQIVLAHRNSSQALALLKQRMIHVAGTHLRDPATGESNIRELGRIFTKNSVVAISLAVWEEGIVVAKGNPKAIRGIEDFARPDVRIVNRETGAGSRLLLDFDLKRLKMNPRRIRGYDDLAMGHLAAAWQVRSGLCDCCIATRGAALVSGLDFVPLTSERYDLVIRRSQLSLPGIQALLETLNRSSFRRELEGVGGYDTASTGRQMRCNSPDAVQHGYCATQCCTPKT
ncbi:MAG: substrate-binding domain-containing protein [Bryobacteraceae bacterium]